MSAYVPPAALPPHVLNHGEVRRAIARRDFGALFRIAKSDLDISYGKIAESCGIDRDRVGLLARGKGDITSLAKIQDIADGMRIPGPMLGLAPRGWEGEARGVSLPAKPAIEILGAETWELVDSLKRSSMSPEAAEQIYRAVLRLASNYPVSTPSVLFPQLSTLFVAVRGALDDSQSLQVRRRLVESLGILSGVAANSYVDAGFVDRSAQYFDLAGMAAREAANDGIHAWLLVNQSILPYFSQNTDGSIEMLTRAEELAVSANPRRRAWVAAMLARAHAAAGESRAALQALGRSSMHLDRADAKDGIDFFDEPRLSGISGTLHMRIGDAPTATRLLFDALGRRAESDLKGRSLLTLDLAECHVIEGEIEECVAVANRALDVAGDSIVKPIVRRVHTLCERLGPWKDTYPVISLNDRVSELGSATND